MMATRTIIQPWPRRANAVAEFLLPPPKPTGDLIHPTRDAVAEGVPSGGPTSSSGCVGSSGGYVPELGLVLGGFLTLGRTEDRDR